jgi:hypothetical protein
VNGFHVWKARYSQPVITKHYSKNIPDFQTPIKSLWLNTMAQIYPEDRGTNYAVRYGRKVAREIIASVPSVQGETESLGRIVGQAVSE